tara:strand:- start:3302 stop:4531 length:1230 start_codon:yes stop_codon:yes gene_type:complete
MTQIEKQNVPKLRFPEFEETWQKHRLGELGSFKSGVGFSESEQGGTTGIPFYKVSDMNLPGNEVVMTTANNYVTEEQVTKLKFKPIKARAVIFAKVGAAIFLERKRQAKDFLLDNNMMAFIPRDDVRDEYLSHLFSVLRLSKFAQVGALPSYNSSDLATIKLSLPTLPEQRKIASYLDVVDMKIAQLSRKKALHEDYKKSCIHQLLSQKIRFKDENGKDFPDWEEKPLHDFLTETKAKSDGSEAVFSVSVHKGLINQIEHLGRSYSASDTGHYNRVEPGDIVYTKSPTGDFPFGIVKQSRLDRPVIVSPLYGVFRPETSWLGYWLHAYFESNIYTGNYLKPIIQKGAKNTINITNTTFLSATLKVSVDPDEQRKITDFLSALDRKIELVGKELTYARTFKQGLLQQMFV